MSRVASDRIERLDDEFTLDDVGSTLLEDLAKGLYQPEEVIREYIQNAIDAHRLWQYESGTQPEGPIQVEVRGNTLSIIDYGIGMDARDIIKVKAIAVSPKRSADVDLTGHKGVGIWAGLSFFESLSVYSTKRGSDRGYELTIHFKNIVETINEDRSIAAVLNPNYRIDMYKEDAEDHCTYITLSNPVRREDFFLNPDQVRQSVQRSCPCQLDPSFVFHDVVEQWYQQNGFEQFDIEVDGVPVFRSYPSSVESFETGDITLNDKTVARYWRAINKKNGVIEPTGDQLIGFRLFQNGFILGGMNIYSDDQPGYDPISIADYLKWYVGEIHVTLSDLRPDLPRKTFEGSEIARQFVKRLRAWYQDIERISRVLAETRNRNMEYGKYIEEIKKFQGRGESPPLEDLRKWEERLRQHTQKVNDARGKKIVDYRITSWRDTKARRGEATALIHKALATYVEQDATFTDSTSEGDAGEPMAPHDTESNEETSITDNVTSTQPVGKVTTTPLRTRKPAPQPTLDLFSEDLAKDEDLISPMGDAYDPAIWEPMRDTILGLLSEVLEEKLPGEARQQREILDTLKVRLNLLAPHV